MKVLVIIPTHEREEFLMSALHSVAAQTRAADELIVIGDVRPSASLLGSYARYFSTAADCTVSSKLNEAVIKSDCDAFVVLSDDDYLEPGFLERTVGTMEREAVDIVYTDCFLFGDEVGPAFAGGEWTRHNIDHGTVPLITSLCRRAAWRMAGGFQETPLFDWDFWWRCCYIGATAYWLREHLWNYRVHGGQALHREDLEKNRALVTARHDRMRESFGPEVKC